MVQNVLLAVNVPGKATRCFVPMGDSDAATVAGIIMMEAELLKLNVEVTVVPCFIANADNVAAWLEEVWDEEGPSLMVPGVKQSELFPRHAYGR